MGDMTALTPTLQGSTYTFRLLEADIPTLTATSSALYPDTNFVALARAIGFQENWGAESSGATLFEALLRLGDKDYGQDVLTGKPLLARAAQHLADAMTSFPTEVLATLTIALKGGGMTMAAAGGVAGQLMRMNKSADAKFTYVQSVLVPQILSAAAALKGAQKNDDAF